MFPLTVAWSYGYAMTASAHRRSDTEDTLSRQAAREVAGVAEARAELEAGLFVDADEIDAWIDSLDTGDELPPPPTRHR